MNNKHLLWLFPLFLLIGFMINYFLSFGVSMVGYEISEVVGKAYKECDVFVQSQNKCLYETNASDYERCYWKAEKDRNDWIEIQEFLKNVED